MRIKGQIYLLLCLFVGISELYGQKDSTDFVFTWRTYNPGISNDSSITIRTQVFLPFDFDVDWNNDGIFDTSRVFSTIFHQYPDTGTYTIRIRGTFPRPIFGADNSVFGNTRDKDKIISIQQWGNQPWSTLIDAFFDCDSLEYGAVDSPNLTNATHLSGMFESTSKFNGNLDNWDVSSITDFERMFKDATSFDQPLNNWDVSSAENMVAMFDGASQFNQPLSNWDVSSLLTSSRMFANTTLFNQPIGNWITDSVRFMNGMFRNATSFNNPLNSWDVSSVIDMNGMFWSDSGNMVFNQPLNNWNVSSVTNMNFMFRGSIFNYPLNSWDVSSVQNFGGMFMNDSIFNQSLNNWDVSSSNYMHFMFYNAKQFNQPVNNWDVSSVTSMFYMFSGASQFNQPLSNWSTSALITTAWLFEGASTFNQNLGNWDISNMQNSNFMLSYSGMSVENYDSTLISWQAKSHLSNVYLGAESLSYCLSDSARTLLISDGWVFLGDSLNCLAVSAIDIQQPVEPSSLNIYPNPNSGMITIEKAVENIEGQELFIYNIQGQLVYSNTIIQNKQQLDISHFKSGVYLVRLGNQTQRLMVQ